VSCSRSKLESGLRESADRHELFVEDTAAAWATFFMPRQRGALSPKSLGRGRWQSSCGPARPGVPWPCGAGFVVEDDGADESDFSRG